MNDVAQTGHILRVKNRPGNVHDSKQAVAFLRELIDGLRTAFGRRLPLEFRMDAAFCQRGVFRLLAARGCAYAIKVHLWVMLYRKRVGHESPKNFQLDLFTPDDGHFEYAAVATNLALPALYAFLCGRGAQEKTIAELKGKFRPGRHPHAPLRRQQRLAAAQRPRPHPHPAASSSTLSRYRTPGRANAPIRT